MNIEPDVYKKLSAIDRSGKFVHIPNKIMRKLKWKEEQDRQLTPNSVCIVCNFSFMTKNRGWSDNIGAICHPFKDTSIFPDQSKLHLFSESDFCDPLWMPGLVRCKAKEDYKYDFFCFTIDQAQGVKCKGYHSIPMMAKIAAEQGLRGVVLDYYNVFPRPTYKNEEKGSLKDNTRITRKRVSKAKNIDVIKGSQSQKRITKLMNESRYVIFPNTRDASPRTIVETLLRGKPILVNKNIYGGWKYVNNDNGMFFDGATKLEELDSNSEYYYNELKTSMQKMRDHKFNSDDIINNHLSEYGFVKSSRRLAKIINKMESKKKYRYVAYREFENMLRQYCK
jgi:hypothetical protein